MNKKELSAYMSALGKAGGKKLAEMKRDDPDYFRRLRQIGIEKQRRAKAEAVDKSKKPCVDGT